MAVQLPVKVTDKLRRDFITRYSDYLNFRCNRYFDGDVDRMLADPEVVSFIDRYILCAYAELRHAPSIPGQTDFETIGIRPVGDKRIFQPAFQYYYTKSVYYQKLEEMGV